MEVYYYLTILMTCLFISVQDFKFRAVYWWLFPLLFFALGLLTYDRTGANQITTNLFANIGFVFLQLVLLSIYFSVKERRLVNIFAHHFGVGDLLFLLSVTVYFSLFNYILFYVTSLIMVIAFTLILNQLVKKTNPKIPLAGEQALLLVLFMAIDWLSSSINFSADLWVVNYFNV